MTPINVTLNVTLNATLNASSPSPLSLHRACRTALILLTLTSSTTVMAMSNMSNISNTSQESASEQTPQATQTTHSASASLVGGEWRIEDIAGGGVIDMAQANLSFSADGQLSGSATCNRLIGRYEATSKLAESDEKNIEGGELKFDALGTTMMACPEALEHQERKLLKLLAKVERFNIDQTGALILHTSNGERITARRP